MSLVTANNLSKAYAKGELKVEALKDLNFEIEPAIQGTFEHHRRTLVFVPKGGLKQATIYKVALKKGFKLKTSG